MVVFCVLLKYAGTDEYINVEIEAEDAEDMVERVKERHGERYLIIDWVVKE